MKCHQMLAVSVMLGAAVVCQAHMINWDKGAPGSRGTSGGNFNNHGNSNFGRNPNNFGGSASLSNFNTASPGFGGQRQSTGVLRQVSPAVPVGVIADILATIPRQTSSGYQGNQGNFQGNQGNFQGFYGNQGNSQGNQGHFQGSQGGFGGNQGSFQGNFQYGFGSNVGSSNQFRRQSSGNFAGSGFGGHGSSNFQ